MPLTRMCVSESPKLTRLRFKCPYIFYDLENPQHLHDLENQRVNDLTSLTLNLYDLENPLNLYDLENPDQSLSSLSLRLKNAISPNSAS